MSQPVLLDNGLTLRPAQTRDRAPLEQLLKRLERELIHLTPTSSTMTWVLALTLVGLLGVSIITSPPFRTVPRWLVLLVLAIGAGLAAALHQYLQREWERYWVIDHQGTLLACAKLNQQATYSVLYDLYVVPEWRRQGLGSSLVRHLSQNARKPLYLACTPERLPFYQRLGFAEIAPRQLPLILQYDLGLPIRPGIIPLVRL